MEQSTFIVHWKGPYSEAELEKLNDGNGLYFITGIQYRKRTSSMIQYFGITKGKLKDRIKRHHKVEEFTRERQFWFGKFAYPNQFSREQLEMVENILVYFWQPELNDKKKAKIKSQSSWFHTGLKVMAAYVLNNIHFVKIFLMYYRGMGKIGGQVIVYILTDSVKVTCFSYSTLSDDQVSFCTVLGAVVKQFSPTRQATRELLNDVGLPGCSHNGVRLGHNFGLICIVAKSPDSGN